MVTIKLSIQNVCLPYALQASHRVQYVQCTMYIVHSSKASCTLLTTQCLWSLVPSNCSSLSMVSKKGDKNIEK